MTIKDAADLFAVEGEQAKDTLEEMKSEAQDALGLLLSEAPEGSQRERYRYVTEGIFPLLFQLEDEGEQGAALDDVAGRLGLRKTDLRKAFREFEERSWHDRESSEHDEVEEDLAPEPGTKRHERAMALLRSPDILETAARDMERLGHIGEWIPKKLLFVCAVSAKAGLPIQPSIHAESSSGKNYLADTGLSLLPPEMIIRRSAISAKALYRTGEELKGKVLYLQEHSGSEDADFTFRVMQSDGKLVYEATEQGPDGALRTVVHEKEGPLVIVQTTTEARLFDENAARVFAIYLDESAEQTERIVRSALSRAANGGISREEREAIMEAWHDAIRLLQAAEVIVPYAERIEAPSRLVRMRRDINRLLDVIRVLAWLHQHARDRDEQGRIVATEEDFHMALELVRDSLKRAWEEMTPAEEAVMHAIQSLPEATRKNGFRRSELQVPGHDARRVQESLKALSESGHIECEKRGGPGGYLYTVPREPEEAGLGISLRPLDEGGGDGSKDSDGATEEDFETDGEDDEGDLPRDTAWSSSPAIEGADSREEEATARSREEEAQDDFSDDGLDEEEDEEMDPLAELTERGWFRAQTSFPMGDGPAEDLPDDDPFVRRLRHSIPIYQGPGFWKVGDDFPRVLTAEEVFDRWLPDDDEDGPSAVDRPTTPDEARECLKRVVPLLQAKLRDFYDPGYFFFCEMAMVRASDDPNKWCREAYLHAELWRNQETGEELWVLIALRKGWRPPDKAIEEVVYWRVTTSEAPPEEALDTYDDDGDDDDGDFELC
jgi:hypothetical protein